MDSYYILNSFKNEKIDTKKITEILNTPFIPFDKKFDKKFESNKSFKQNTQNFENTSKNENTIIGGKILVYY